jgi:Mg2+/Co2+ transporter CorB
MIIEISVTLLAIVLLIAAAAFLTGAESALASVSRARMLALEGEGNRRAKAVNELLASPERVAGAVMIGSNLAKILASVLATALLVRLFGPAGIVYTAAVVTLLVVVFSEVLPKTIARSFPDRIALAVAPVMRALVAWISPLARAVEWGVRTLLRLPSTGLGDAANALAAHQDSRGTTQLRAKAGAGSQREAHVPGGILGLGDLQVSDIMIHRTKMEMVNADDPPAKIVEDVLKAQYSRVPIWKDEPENIVGVLHTKDLLSAMRAAEWDVAKIDVLSLASKPWFIPDTTYLKEQLNQFLKQKSQLSLVVDEYGEVQGLITLEDILEEIVGQIVDEHDTPEMGIRPQADDTVNVDGSVPIRDLNRYMDWDLPDDEATTIAGLVIHEAQTIPEPGQVFTFYGYRFEILRKNRNKIAALRVKPLSNDTLPTGAGADALRSTRT